MADNGSNGSTAPNPATIQYSYLTFLAPAGRTASRSIAWRCSCACGRIVVVPASKVRRGAIKSCGCRRRVVASQLSRSHGEAGQRTPEYRAWKSMRTRCWCKTATAYENYGGRGIDVCDRWRASFENFLEDMGRRPSPAHSLDRIDNNGPYSPQNCRWAAKGIQSLNRRSVAIIRIGDFSGSLKDVAAYFSVDYRALHYRTKRLGMSVDLAINYLTGGKNV